MLDLLGLLWNGLFGTPSALLFTCFISALFIYSLGLYMAKADKRSWVVSRAPGLLTTLGLFGTFWGVAEGLGSFDATNIDASVMELLDGMKLAFWTSILGMFYALLLNIFQFVMGAHSDEKASDEVDAKDIDDAIYKVGEVVADGFELAIKSTDKGNASLLQQVSVLTTETINMRTSLLDAFNAFAAKVAENNSQALINALREVIADFNAKINEQFGDNFKQLNQAVGALLTWQENYRKQLEALVNQFQEAQKGIGAARQGIAEIKSNMDSVPATMAQLKNMVTALDGEIKQANELLKGFTELRNQATEVFPEIKRGITEVTQNLKNNIAEVSASVKNSAKAFETSTKAQNEAIQKLGQNITTVTLNLENSMKKGADDVQATFKKALEEVDASIKKSFKQLDGEMETSLQSVIGVMGSKLASVSDKMISDYQILTRQITELSARSRGQGGNKQ